VTSAPPHTKIRETIIQGCGARSSEIFGGIAEDATDLKLNQATCLEPILAVLVGDSAPDRTPDENDQQ
jgi:hypothetical protein